jgi:hypothetical protein
MTNAVKRIAAGLAAAVAAGIVPIAATIAAAPAHAGDCAPGYVMGVPISDGRLPVKCVPVNNIPPGYVDGTGGNAQGGIGR